MIFMIESLLCCHFHILEGILHYRTWLVYSNDGLPQNALGLREQASWMHTHLVSFVELSYTCSSSASVAWQSLLTLGGSSWSRSMVMRVRLRLAAGSLSFLPRTPLVGVRDVAPWSRRSDGSSFCCRRPLVRQPAAFCAPAASRSCWTHSVISWRSSPLSPSNSSAAA